MFTRRVWLKVAQKKIRARGASFCHMGVCTKLADKGPMLRDAWTCSCMHRALSDTSQGQGTVRLQLEGLE